MALKCAVTLNLKGQMSAPKSPGCCHRGRDMTYSHEYKYHVRPFVRRPPDQKLWGPKSSPLIDRILQDLANFGDSTTCEDSKRSGCSPVAVQGDGQQKSAMFIPRLAWSPKGRCGGPRNAMEDQGFDRVKIAAIPDTVVIQ